MAAVCWGLHAGVFLDGRRHAWTRAAKLAPPALLAKHSPCRARIRCTPLLSDVKRPPCRSAHLREQPPRAAGAQELRAMVLRGAHEHPGAVAVEDEKGAVVNLSRLSLEARAPLGTGTYPIP